MRVAIVHETDGQKYFAAIDQLKTTNDITSLTYIQGRCLRNLGRDILKQDVKPSTALKKFITAWKYRVQFPFTKYDITIIAFGPYDFRFIYYALFSRAKRIITHTSWPEWNENPPVQYGHLTCVFEFLWRLVFRIKNIECVAVTEPAKISFNQKHPLIKTLVIPHAVGQQLTSANRSKKRKTFVLSENYPKQKGFTP